MGDDRFLCGIEGVTIYQMTVVSREKGESMYIGSLGVRFPANPYNAVALTFVCLFMSFELLLHREARVTAFVRTWKRFGPRRHMC